MPLIAKILISGLIIAAITVGGVIAWKMSSQPAPDLTTAATLKANNIDNSITVPFSTPVVLSWESKNVGDCLISGDWYSPVSNSGSQSVGEIKKSTNYIFVCVDNKGKEVSDSITVNIDEKTIPQNVLLTDLFKDFRYFWKKELCLGLTNDPDVVALQTALFFEGIFSPQEKISGNYDNDTLLAVKKFQENYGIVPPTGCVGPQTMAKLNELFYYYNYGDEVASQESSQNQITTTSQKISSYQQQIKSAPIITSIEPAPIIPTTPTTTPAKISPTTPPATSIITTTARPFVDIKINNSNRSAITVQKGETATLTWTSKNAKSCVASGNWSGSKPTSNSTGEITAPINKYATFKLTCEGENNQNAADSVYVSVPYTSTTASTDEKCSNTNSTDNYTYTLSGEMTKTKRCPPVIDEIEPPSIVINPLAQILDVIKIKGSGFSPGSIIHFAGRDITPGIDSTENTLKFSIPFLIPHGQIISGDCPMGFYTYYITVEEGGMGGRGGEGLTSDKEPFCIYW